MGMGLSIGVEKEEPWPPEEKPPVVGIFDWLKANWKWLLGGSLGIALTIALLKRKK